MCIQSPSSVSGAHEPNWMTTCVSKLRTLRPVEQVVVGVAALALTGLAYNAIRRVFAASLWQGLAVAGVLSGIGIYLFRKCCLASPPKVLGIRSLEGDRILGLNESPCNGRLAVELREEGITIVATWKDGRPTTGPASVSMRGELSGQCDANGLFEDGLPVIPRPLLAEAQWAEDGSKKVFDAEGRPLNGAYRVLLDQHFLLSADWREGLPTGAVIGWADGREREVIRGICDDQGRFVQGEGPRCMDGTLLPPRNTEDIYYMQKGTYSGENLLEGEIWGSQGVFRGTWQANGRCRGELIEVTQHPSRGLFSAQGLFDPDWNLITGVKYVQVEREGEEEEERDDMSAFISYVRNGQETHRQPWPAELSRNRWLNHGWWSEPLPAVDITQDPHLPKIKV